MNSHFARSFPLILLSLLLLNPPAAVRAGSLEPPGGPAATTSYTVEDIYLRLESGIAGSKSAFSEPVNGPTAPTMHTLNEIMDRAPIADDTGGAIDANVLEDKKYWGLNSGQWGPGTGTMPNIGQQNITPTTASQAIKTGYHDGTGTVSGDGNLITDNIRAGITIFGVTGKAEVVDTASGNATPSDIALGKKAWVDGSEVTGTGSLSGYNVCKPDAMYSSGGRWCDNKDGYVGDTTTGLIWPKSFFMGKLKYENLVLRQSQIYGDGDSRLPTMNELFSAAITGPEKVSSAVFADGTPVFINIQDGIYFTNQRFDDDTGWGVNISGGYKAHAYDSVEHCIIIVK